jgi:hypothetical protein
MRWVSRTKLVAGRVTFEPVQMDGFEACFAYQIREGQSQNNTFLHGGAYVAGK